MPPPSRSAPCCSSPWPPRSCGAKNVERVEALIAADREAIADKIGEGPAELKAGQGHRHRHGPQRPRPTSRALYQLEQGGTGHRRQHPRPAPRCTADGGGRSRSRCRRGEHRRGLVAPRVSLGGGAVLYVGRRLEDRRGDLALIARRRPAVRRPSAPSWWRRWASRRILRRVNAINDACDRVRVATCPRARPARRPATSSAPWPATSTPCWGGSAAWSRACATSPTGSRTTCARRWRG